MLTLQDPQEQELQEPEQQLQELSKLVSLNSLKCDAEKWQLALEERPELIDTWRVLGTHQGDMLIDLGLKKNFESCCEL